MSAPGLAARQAASALLSGVLNDQSMMSELTGANGPLKDLAANEKARAQALALGVLRNLTPIDMVLAQFMSKEPLEVVLNSLRILVFEVVLDNIPAHAAVDAAVRQVRANRKASRLAGLTNAVGRKVAANGAEIWSELEPNELPNWISGPVAKAFGADTVAAIEGVLAAPPPLDLTVKAGADAEALIVEADAIRLTTGSLRLQRAGQVSRLPGYDAGDWWVQDAAAAVPVRLLGDINGLSALDLCAAPGGKTMQLADAGASVTAVDISANRMKRVSENLKRTKLKADLITADLLNWQPEQTYDVILLDAPCSASGTLRRHPDLPHARPDPDLRPLLRLQSDLIDRALGWLSPGGRLIYCTCSLLPAEGEVQIAKALERHADVHVTAPQAVAGLPDGAITAENHLRLRPDYWAEIGGMDGFFAAILTRKGGATNSTT